MSNVAKHDHKQEREGDDGKKAGVDLLVRCNAIRVHDSLKAFREFIHLLERRRHLFVRSSCRIGSTDVPDSSFQQY